MAPLPRLCDWRIMYIKLNININLIFTKNNYLDIPLFSFHFVCVYQFKYLLLHYHTQRYDIMTILTHKKHKNI